MLGHSARHAIVHSPTCKRQAPIGSAMAETSSSGPARSEVPFHNCALRFGRRECAKADAVQGHLPVARPGQGHKADIAIVVLCADATEDYLPDVVVCQVEPKQRVHQLLGVYQGLHAAWHADARLSR